MSMTALKIPTINFVGKRTYAIILSAMLLALSVFSLSTNGLKLGIDFTGGTLIEVGYKQSVDLSQVRSTIDEAGFKHANVQYFGSTNEILIRLKPQTISSAKLSTKIIRL
jgi:preprotein translocase subunit SecF